jgi:hypothetical protein
VENQRLIKALTRAGMTSSNEVFTFDFNVYNTSDSRWQPFYDFGGWLYLEEGFSEQRQFPDVADIESFFDFLNKQDIRFVIIKLSLIRRFPFFDQLDKHKEFITIYYDERGIIIYRLKSPLRLHAYANS